MDFGYWVMHGHGISREKIEAVPHWRDSELFDQLERLVLEYAEAITETPPTVDDELVRRLLDHLVEAQLVELTMIILLENMRSRFNSAAGLTGQGFKDRCEIPRLDGRVCGNGRKRGTVPWRSAVVRTEVVVDHGDPQKAQPRPRPGYREGKPTWQVPTLTPDSSRPSPFPPTTTRTPAACDSHARCSAATR